MVAAFLYLSSFQSPMPYKPSHRPSAFWKHQLCARAAKGQNDESSEETDGSGRTGRAAPPWSTRFMLWQYIKHLCEPVVVFPVMPKLKPCCFCKKNSFCIAYTATNYHPCPFISLLTYSCGLSFVFAWLLWVYAFLSIPLCFCRCCSLELQDPVMYKWCFVCE